MFTDSDGSLYGDEDSVSEGNDTSYSDANTDPLYIPPSRCHRKQKCIKLPNKLCLMDLSQLDKFMAKPNKTRVYSTPPGCQGALAHISIKSIGLGGAVSVT